MTCYSLLNGITRALKRRRALESLLLFYFYNALNKRRACDAVFLTLCVTAFLLRLTSSSILSSFPLLIGRTLIFQ